MAFVLRPYQSKAVAEILALFQRRIPGVILESAVGSGKTSMGMDVVSRLLAAGLKGAWFAHRVELCDQAAERADLYGIPHGRIAPGSDRSGHAFHICSIDTVRARIAALEAWLRSLDFVVFDEAHHIAAAGWTLVAETCANALRLGLTATPFRLDGKGLGDEGHFTHAVRAPGIRDLTRAGYLSEAYVYAPPTGLDLTKVAKRGGDFALGEMAAAVEAAGLAVIGRRWYARHCPGRPAIVFCPTVELAEASAAAYREAGWLATSVDGTMSPAERARAVGGLANGKVQVLTSVSLIGEGFDCPEVAAVIMERPTASTSLYIQMVGRALRPHADKSYAVILDLVGNTGRHGMYDEPRQWDLKSGLKGMERAVTGTWRCIGCRRVHSQTNADSRMACGCGHTQAVRGFNPPQIESHPPIAGIEAERLLAMKWKDALAAMKTRDELVAFYRLYNMAHPDKCKNPEGMARMTLEQRGAYKARFRAGGRR